MTMRLSPSPRFASQIVFVTGKEWKHLRRNYFTKATFLTEANPGDTYIRQKIAGTRKIKAGVALGLVSGVQPGTTKTEKPFRQGTMFHLDPQHHPFKEALENHLKALMPQENALLLQGFQTPADHHPTQEGVLGHIESVLRRFVDSISIISPKAHTRSVDPSSKSSKHINNRPAKLAYLGDKDTWVVHLATRDGGDLVSKKALLQAFDIYKDDKDTLVFLEDRQTLKVFPLLWGSIKPKQKSQKRPTQG